MPSPTWAPTSSTSPCRPCGRSWRRPGRTYASNARLEHIRIQDGAVSAVTVCQNGQTYDLPCPPCGPRPWVTAPGIPLKCCIASGLYPWSPSPLPWVSASSTGQSDMRCRPVPFSTRATRLCPPQHLQAVLPPAQRPQRLLASASAPAARWWPPRPSRGGVVTNGMSVLCP